MWTLIIITMLIASAASLHRPSRSHALILATIIIVATSGIRYKTGYDFDAYENIYIAIANGEAPTGIEPSWIALNTISATIINSPIAIFISSSALIYGIISFVLYKESEYAAIGLLAFVLQIYFYWESLSIIRQYAAIALSLLAIHNWINNRKKIFLFLSIASISFHLPAVIIFIIPAFTKINSRRAFIFVATVVGATLNFSPSEYLDYFDLFYKYKVYFDGTIIAEGKTSTGLTLYTRILLALAMVYLIDKSPSINQTRKNLIINSIIFGYALFFSFYESTALRRISYYFFIYEILAIAYLAKDAFRKTDTKQKYLSAAFIASYLIFGTSLLTKDVWTNPTGRQEDSQTNYEYRIIFE